MMMPAMNDAALHYQKKAKSPGSFSIKLQSFPLSVVHP
jgi:hypothetical protein